MFTKTFVKYIFSAVVATAVSITAAEVITTVVTAKKMVDAYKKEVGEDQYKNLNKDQKKKLYSDSIKEAAKARVESIKKDPRSEIFVIAAMGYYFVGNWMGYRAGAKNAFGRGARFTVDKYIDILKKYAPEEFNQMLRKIQTIKPEDILISRMNIDGVFTKYKDEIIWDPKYCKDAEVIDGVAKEVTA